MVISGLSMRGFVFQHLIEKGIPSILKITLAYITGIVITPILLPYVPVKMFAFKGLINGLLLGVILFAFKMMGNTNLEIFSWFLLMSAISSFMAMNFTGTSTFTSLSGVKKEMKTFVPIQISFATFGLILLTINNLFN
jgi:acetyl-CoA decarbonylase/synthase complex subunit gamma